MRASRFAVAATAALAAAAITPDASAYCRTSVCNQETSQVCTPAFEGDCGTPLFWATACVGFSMQADASSQVPLATATSVFEAAFATWTSAPCAGGGTPSLVVQHLADATCHSIEYNDGGGNANVIMFDDASWPYAGSSATLALTTVTYNLDTGEIYDADMELNSASVMFSTSDAPVEFDLASIAQHEAGHFLGLAHSHDTTATMFMSYNQGDTSLRTLEVDDIAAICDAYPPGDSADPSCDATPRHGFSAICGGTDVPQDSSSCSAAQGVVGDGAPRAGALALALACLGLVAARRRRRLA